MPTFSNLVVPTDATRSSDRTLRVAAALAAQLHVPTTLLSAVTSEDQIYLARERLEKQAEAVDFPAGVTIDVRRGRSVRSELLARIRHDRRSLVVMATRAQHPVAEMLLGSVANDVVMRSPRPIVLVGPHADAPPGGRFTDLLACVDGGPRSELLIPLTESAAADLGLQPLLLEVDTSAGGPSARPVDDVDGTAGLTSAAQLTIQRRVVHAGSPATGILAAAEDYAAPLIAVATGGRDPFARLRESSTAIAVTREAPLPVLVLGPSAEA